MSSSYVVTQLNRLGFTASSEWIEACINWCRESDPAVTGQGLVNSVTQQWLLTDLRNDGVQSRPQIKPEWTQKDVIKGQLVTGRLCLQVISAVDIGQSAYSQLQSMLKVQNENSSVSAEDTQNPSQAPTQYRMAAWEPKTSRMIKLQLSDGFSVIEALEHEPLLDLKYPVPPGLKVQIMGPVQCRRGCMLLTKKSFRVLGGQVDDMKDESDVVSKLMAIIGTDNVGQSSTAVTTTRVEIPNETFADEEDDLFSAIEMPAAGNNGDQLRKRQNQDEIGGVTKKKPNSNSSAFMDDFDDDLLRAAELETTKSTKPFQYLTTADKGPGSEVIVKACITTLASRLNIKDGAHGKYWHVLVAITDGSESIIASIDGSILVNWIGIEAKVYGLMRREDKDKAKLSVVKVSDILLKFNGLMKLRFQGGSVEPAIVQMLPLNPGHAQQLKVRQN